MQHIKYEIPGGRTVHVAEEVMLSFAGLIKGKVLCGGLKERNHYTRAIPATLNRDAWFTPLEEIPDVTCTRCRKRHLAALEPVDD